MKPLLLSVSIAFLLFAGLAASETAEDTAHPPDKPAASEDNSSADGEAPEEGVSLEDLFKRMEKELAEIKTVRADFRQEKDLAMFEKTVVLSGRMAVQNPGKFAWHVDEPVKYSMVIIDADVSQWDEDTNRVTKVNIDRDPVFQIAFKQLTLWFSGDYAKLVEDYDVDILQRDPYVVIFTPREGSIFEKMIDGVTVTFREDERYIKKIEIREVTEDKTTISFKNPVLNEEVPPELWRVRR